MPDNSNITIDEEFRDLLPPLTAETYEELEKSIISEGCRDSIVLWDSVIVDGHNRYAICRKHDLLFQTTEKDFASRDVAKIWIISTQLARRHLSPKEQSYYRGVQYNLEKSMQGGTGANRHTKEQTGQNVQSADTDATAKRIAKQYNVTGRTIRRDGKTAEVIDKIGAVSPNAKKEILAGKAKITKRDLSELDKVSGEELSAVSGQIEAGTYVKNERAMPTRPPASNLDSIPEKEIHIPKGWEMPVPIPAKKQTWCAFISAGIDALGGVIGNIEKDLRNKLPLIESHEERDFLRNTFQSYIDKQLEIIKQI